MTVRVGDYILYPAFFILIGIIIIACVVLIVLLNVLKERKQINIVDKNFEITKWQRKYLCQFCRQYISDNELNDNIKEDVKKFEKYINESKYWNVDELLEIDENLVRNITTILFKFAMESYELRHYDDAVLIINAIDFINGGMDNPDYFDGDYPWIGEDIPEMRNHQDMTDEEARTIYLYESALEELYSFVDDDLDKIPEAADVLDFCKRISKQDMENASGDICSAIDILELNEKTRDIVAKALFNNISILIADIFFNDDANENVKYIDEYRRYQLRALASVIDKQLYSDVVTSIDE